MNTLYDILGIGRQATPAQIDAGYQARLDYLKENGTSPEEDIQQLRILREAHSILSSENKRRSYDARLAARSASPAVVHYQAEEKNPMPWVLIIALAIVLALGASYYHYVQLKKTRAEQLAIEAAKAKAEKEKAELAAAQEEAALERARVNKQQHDEAVNRTLSAQARYEGQRAQAEIDRFEREKKRQMEQEERQAKLDRERSEREAKMRSQEEIFRMQRALAIPIQRH